MPTTVAEVDAAILAEFGDGPARVCRQGIEEGAGGEEEAAVWAVGPGGQASVHAPTGTAAPGIKRPALLSGGRVEREDFEAGCGAIKDAADHQRIALDGR